MRGAAYFLNFSRPDIVHDDDVASASIDICERHKYSHLLLITDPGIIKIGLLSPILKTLKDRKLIIKIYDKTGANPTIDNTEEALSLYYEFKCQALIGFGGGSAIDCAKGVYARLARPKKSITKMRGLLIVGRRKTKLIAIPTTAGTGSEATLAAVITDAKTHEKYALNDPHLIPNYAILSPSLTLGLPPHITAATGMDAFTHAIETYMGRANTRYTKKSALLAIKLIHENLLEVYIHPGNLKGRRLMQIAALEAGVAFTRAYVSHVHCLAHQLGGYYQVPHGLANAIILPVVLKALRPRIDRGLAKLCDHLQLVDKSASKKEKAQAFITLVETINDKMNLVNNFGHLIKTSDLDTLSSRAFKEGFPLYPVPELWDQKRYMAIYQSLQKEQ